MFCFVDGQIHSTVDKPILILLDSQEKANIRQMPDKNDLFCGYPSDWTWREVNQFITENKNALVAAKKASINRAPQAPQAPKSPKKLTDDHVLAMLDQEKV